MDWINRYIDEPLLSGAARTLRVWHVYTAQHPERLEPVWNLAALSFLAIASRYNLSDQPLVLSLAALLMLALPSIWKLASSARVGRGGYDARRYKSLRARAISKREAEWSLRMTVLFASAGLPFVTRIDDPIGSAFMAGACIWFVLTAPVRFYLEAAEPPAPDEGDRAHQGILQFG
jgi:hypothetical protein